MTEPTRAKANRRPRRSASQLFIAALVVFGIAASVLLLFSENIQWLRVGLVSALWAAIVGAFAMTKYRRDAVADQAKAKDLQTVYELQLAREISARREYELGVEARVRSEVQLETNEVAALRAELAHLRENLQLLFDGNLPAERIALRADATRMQELGGRNYDGYQPAASGLYVPGGGQSPNATTDVQSVPVPGLATPFDEPVTAETSVLYPDVPIGSEDPASTGYGAAGYNSSSNSSAGYGSSGQSSPGYNAPGYSSSGYATTENSEAEKRTVEDRTAGPNRRESEQVTRIPGGRRRVPTPPRTPTAPPVDEPVGAPAGRVASPEPTPAPAAPAAPVPEPTPEPAYEPPSVATVDSAPEPAPEIGSEIDAEAAAPRRRRRAEPADVDPSGAHSNGRSVAEIMAGLQSGSDEAPARRHRRRAE